MTNDDTQFEQLIGAEIQLERAEKIRQFRDHEPMPPEILAEFDGMDNFEVIVAVVYSCIAGAISTGNPVACQPDTIAILAASSLVDDLGFGALDGSRSEKKPSCATQRRAQEEEDEE